MTSPPKPVKYTIEEGGPWYHWVPGQKGRKDEGCSLVHSIMFDDGSVFDAVSGWRQWRYCPHCARRDVMRGQVDDVAHAAWLKGMGL